MNSPLLATHIEQATNEDYIALLIARNRCGPNLSIAELLHRNSVAPADFEACMKSATFTTRIKQHVKELTASGFGVEAKAALLHEAGVPVVYGILTDAALPAMARLRAHEMLGDIAGKSKKVLPPSAAANPSGDRYQLVINIGGGTVETFKAVPERLVFSDVALASAPDEDEEGNEIDPDYAD